MKGEEVRKFCFGLRSNGALASKPHSKKNEDKADHCKVLGP